MNTTERGRKAEDIALEWLLSHGFVLRERNYRAGHREIDLIVETSDRLHIVEVKSLVAPVTASPYEKVDRAKQMKLASAARSYIGLEHIVKEVQFDVVSIVFYEERHELEYIPAAFFPIY